MKILTIAPQPFFTPRGTPFSVYYRTMVMAEKGARIDLLTYGDGADVAIEGVRTVRIPRIPVLGPIPVGPSWKKLILDVFMIVWTVGLLSRHRYPVVHAHEEAIFWCRFLKPLFRFRLIYDMHSSLPQQLSNFAFTRSNFLVQIFKWLEEGSLKTADAVVTICPDLRDYALSAGVRPERQFLIENSIFEPPKLASETNMSPNGRPASPLPEIDFGRPTVLYAGTFEAYQGIDLLVYAFQIAVAEIPNAQLILAGGTVDQVTSIRVLVEKLGLAAQCRLVGRVSKSEAARLVERASVLVSPRVRGTNTPLKIYEQLASGKPIVATRIWSHTQVLTNDVSILVEPEPEDMARGILQALREPELSGKLGASARSLYVREYARPIYEGKINRLLESISLPTRRMAGP